MKIDYSYKVPEDYIRSEQEQEPILCIHCGKEIEDWYEDEGVFTRLGETAHYWCEKQHEEGRRHG